MFHWIAKLFGKKAPSNPAQPAAAPPKHYKPYPQRVRAEQSYAKRSTLTSAVQRSSPRCDGVAKSPDPIFDPASPLNLNNPLDVYSTHRGEHAPAPSHVQSSHCNNSPTHHSSPSSDHSSHGSYDPPSDHGSSSYDSGSSSYDSGSSFDSGSSCDSGGGVSSD